MEDILINFGSEIKTRGISDLSCNSSPALLKLGPEGRESNDIALIQRRREENRPPPTNNSR